MVKSNYISNKRIRSLSVLVLFSYLFMLSVLTLHHHKTSINYNSKLSLTETLDNFGGIHDPSKCTILHFTNFQSLVKHSFILNEEFDQITINQDSNKLHLLNKTYLISKLRAPPVFFS